MNDNKLPIIAPIFKANAPIEKFSKPIKTKFKLEADFFDELLKRLVEQRKRHKKLFKKVTRPGFGWFRKTEEDQLSFTNLSREILSELIETTFWASLEQEEGRSLEFSVAYRCLENNDVSGNFVSDSDIIFQEFKNFDVKNLVKLAPSIGNKSSILVSSVNNKSLEITGVLLQSYAPLKISVLDPGKLIISYEFENVAIISGSEVVFIKSSLYSHTFSVWEKLFPNEKDDLSSFSDLRASVLINTVREMRKLGHGGALIIVPNNKKYKRSIDSISFPSNNLFTYGSKTVSYVNEKRQEDKYYIGYETTYLAEYFAQFTAVDGATLITRDLDLIGFGVKLKTNTRKKLLSTIYKLDPLDHDEWFKRVELTELGNMRHQSAAKFVCNQPDSVAFVVSQDGNVTVFIWEENREKNTAALYAYSRLELILF